MEHDGFARTSRVTRWRGSFRNAWRTAGAFLDLQSAEDHRRLEAEVRELVSQCLPILMHKRAKLLAADGDGTPPGERWRVELEVYVDRILWPMLSGSTGWHPDNRARIIRQVDAMVAAGVAAGQAKTAEASCTPPPVTWRVDTGWAS